MSGVLNRTVFADRSKGYVMFHDFCKVTTSLGTMVEPFGGFLKYNLNTGQLAGHQYDDMIAKVDRIAEMPMAKEQSMWADVTYGTLLHGGVSIPRTGY